MAEVDLQAPGNGGDAKPLLEVRDLSVSFASEAGLVSAVRSVSYRVGAGDMRAVQQQALAVNASRTALLRVQTERLVQRVNLHLALGGSFEAKQ